MCLRLWLRLLLAVSCLWFVVCGLLLFVVVWCLLCVVRCLLFVFVVAAAVGCYLFVVCCVPVVSGREICISTSNIDKCF